MAGIYIHIPYCRQKCHYCNFFSVASAKFMPEVASAIARESLLQHSYLNDTTVTSVYFGGGTPSLLNPALLGGIMDAVTNNFSLSGDAEITLEANPDDVNSANLNAWKNLGINRLSMGVQSFRNEDLRYLNRIHTGSKALECIDLAQEHGFENLTIDLIYGFPVLSDEAWLDNLQQVINRKIPHLSAYALTVEPRTALDVMIRKGKIAPVEEGQAVRHFELLMEAMEKAGYLHYEISNFCKPDRYARHNTAYWKGEPYLGLGPSAHSFNGRSRQWNVSGIGEYLQAIESGKIPHDIETLEVSQQYNEYVMTGLRTMWGCRESEIELRFGKDYLSHFLKGIGKYVASGHILKDNDGYILTNKGKLMADGIAADLFADDGM
ncbi:radical SAM family heme chaperone HemW [Lentimicrobium sp.]|uniref:radical SAM family heme chaperone HemW n=1 Tax=Lentimicrobium sp. TaxID=2034841 RepID=UPI002D0B6859|nr:radical SAM family heme chaperone HemW [Lentimicrobium sp.]HPF64072.1 radical SAM family heme chaperone HemW [Lentimicrobium sp.]